MPDARHTANSSLPSADASLHSMVRLSLLAAVPLCFCSLRSTSYRSLQVHMFKQSDTVPERQLKLDTSAWHGQRDRAFNQSLTLFEVADLWDRTPSSNVLTPFALQTLDGTHLCKTAPKNISTSLNSLTGRAERHSFQKDSCPTRWVQKPVYIYLRRGAN